MSSDVYNKRRDQALELQDPRKAEAYALVEIARRMEEVRNAEFDRQKVTEVLQLNWKLWTIFQSELNNPDNPMSDVIKRNMIQLSNFVDKHTMAQIKEPSLEGLPVLININRQISSGLMGDQGQEEPVQSTAANQGTAKAAPQGTDSDSTSVMSQATAAPVKKPLFRTKKVGS